jgi:cyanate permease
MFLTIFLPLLNFLILACFGRALGKMGTLYSIFLNTCLGIGYNFYLFIYINQFSTAYYLSLGSWMTVNTLDLQ